MRDALLNDLDELKQYQVITMHDARLSPSAYAKNSLAVKSGDFEKVFKNALKQADLVWLIAPEAEGKLLALTELCLAAEDKENGSILLGCGYDSTLIGTSKSLSFEAMQAAGINTLPVYAGEDLMLAEYFDVLLQLNIKKWVVKPEDGVGCEQAAHVSFGRAGEIEEAAIGGNTLFREICSDHCALAHALHR